MGHKAGTHRAQPVTHGLGKHFESPRRPRDKTRNNTIINIPGQASTHCRALARLAQLQSATVADTSESQHHESHFSDVPNDVDDIPWESEAVDDFEMNEEYVPSDTDVDMQEHEHHIGENQTTMSK